MLGPEREKSGIQGLDYEEFKTVLGYLSKIASE